MPHATMVGEEKSLNLRAMSIAPLKLAHYNDSTVRHKSVEC